MLGERVLATTQLSKSAHLRQASWRDDAVFEQNIRRLHRLGPRPVGELLREVLRAVDRETADHIRGRLSVYAALNPEIVSALGGNDFPPWPLRVVPADDAGDAREAAA